MTAPALAHSTPHGRFYTHPNGDQDVPSITNITGMKDKPALPRWAAREAATFAVEFAENWRGLDTKAAIDLIKGAPWRTSGTASERGDVVHDWIDQYIQSCLEVDGQSRSGKWRPSADDIEAGGRTANAMWHQFIDGFVVRYRPLWIASEFTVWSEKHLYAGTGDFICQLHEGNGKNIYGDNKTGKGVYPEVGMQLAALAKGDYMFDAEGNQVALPKCHGAGVLHIRPRFTRFSPVKHLDSCFKSFLGLRDTFEWHALTADDVIGTAPKVEIKTSAFVNDLPA